MASIVDKFNKMLDEMGGGGKTGDATHVHTIAEAAAYVFRSGDTSNAHVIADMIDPPQETNDALPFTPNDGSGTVDPHAGDGNL